MADGQDASRTSPAFRPVPFIELRESLPSQIAIISPLVDELMRFIARFRRSDGSEVDIETALHEALANAIVTATRKILASSSASRVVVRRTEKSLLRFKTKGKDSTPPRY
jgi:anti-sigma regulatory factor (Ser/Thr protein kinase)